MFYMGLSQVAINILTVQPTRFLSFYIIFQFQTVRIKVARSVIELRVGNFSNASYKSNLREII